MLRVVYSLLFYLSVPLIVIRALLKSKKSKGYLRHFKERFGIIDKAIQPGGIWLHAVSVGETIASVPLMKRLQKQCPNLPLTVTTMTPTGAERVRAAYDDTATHVFVPYDLPSAVKGFLDKVQPSIVIIMETELWPNFLYYCNKRNIPVLLANARLSEKSAKGYARVGRMTRYMLRRINIIAVQTKEDAKRFLKIGAKPNQLAVTGSVKFDVTIPASVHEKANVFRQRFGSDRLVWCAASTHEGEEEKLLTVFEKLMQQFPNLLLLLVPRHPERFAKVAQLCSKKGYKVQLRSDDVNCDNDTQILIGDSMGELNAYYAASDVAFVGGSFIPIGGHNLLEPASLGIPAITGPHVFNFAEITRLLTEAGGVIKVEDSDELTMVLSDWLSDSTKRTAAGQKALQVVKQNGGALDAHVKLVTGLLPSTVCLGKSRENSKKEFLV